MINRREFLGLTVGTGAALALTPELLRAFQSSSGTLIQKAIPSTGEKLPVISLSFSNHPSCADQAALNEVLKSFAGGGCKVFDAMHVNPKNEQFHIDAATQLGIQSKLFWSTRGTPGDAAPTAALVRPHVESLLTRLKVTKIDLVMLPARDDVSWLAPLKEEKKAGRVRYIGVQVITDTLFPQVEAIMRNEPIDFIGVNYDVGSRTAEETTMPVAQHEKVGVMGFFPLSNAYGASCSGSTQHFARTVTRPLPEWATEFDAKTWAQFFLKYVISHPAMTVARFGTTKPAHMLENIGGGIGRLPNEATRKRMAELIDALPPAPPPGRPPGK